MTRQNKLTNGQAAEPATPGRIEIATRFASLIVAIGVSAMFISLLPELACEAKDSINHIAAQIDLDANFSRDLIAAFH